MASGGGSLPAGSRANCSMCLEPFRGRSPKLLPCFHTFCLPCLTQLAERVVQQAGKVSSLTMDENSPLGVPALEVNITCPTCRKDVAVPPEGVAQFQSNFYLEQEEEDSHLQPIICDLCDKGQVASHLCTKCQLKLCFHCHSVHRDCQPVSRSGKTVVLATKSSVDQPLDSVRKQMKIMEQGIGQLRRDQEKLNQQKNKVAQSIETSYTEGLTCLANARDGLLRSLRASAETLQAELRTKIASLQNKVDAFSDMISQAEGVHKGSAELQETLLSESDVTKIEKSLNHEVNFFGHRFSQARTTLLADHLGEFFGMLQSVADTGDPLQQCDAISEQNSDTRNAMLMQPSSSGDTGLSLHQLLSRDSDFDLRSVKIKVDDLSKKMEFLMKKFRESESQGRKFQAENKSLSDEIASFRNKNSILVQEVVSVQSENEKLKGEVCKLQMDQQKCSSQIAKMNTDISDLQKGPTRSQGEENVTSDADIIKGQVKLSAREENKPLTADVSSCMEQLAGFKEFQAETEKQLASFTKKMCTLHLKLQFRVVFHATLASRVVTRTERKLICKRVLTNIGDGYFPQSGVFRAPVAGIYMFLASVKPTFDDKNAKVAIMVSGGQHGFCHAFCKTDISTGFCAVSLQIGERVWLETYERSSSFDDEPFSTSFCGILVRPDLDERKGVAEAWPKYDPVEEMLNLDLF